MKHKTLFILLLALCIPLSAKEVQLRLDLGLDKGVQYMKVDESTEFLHFEKPSYVAWIEGLEQLKNLRIIVFNSTAFIKDFSFLSSCRQLETLVISNVPVQDIAFVAKLPFLKHLVLESCHITSASFDIEANAVLEYIDLSYNLLSKLPQLLHGTGTLRYLNVSYNKIEETDIPLTLSDVLICAEGNRLQFSTSASLKNFFSMLPTEIIHIYQRAGLPVY